MNIPYPIADTHTHVYFPALDNTRSEVMKRAEKHGVQLQVQIGCDEISSLAALDLAKKNKGHYSTLGLHPTDVHNLGKPQQHRISGFENYELHCKNLKELMVWFEQVFEQNKDHIVGFGETGFDFYHNDSAELRAAQETSFLFHIKLAQKFNRTIIIHSRSARNETLEFLRKNSLDLKYDDITPIRGTIHCFTEDIDFAQEITQSYGFFIGIGGIATYPKAENIRNVIKNIPIEYIVTETDAPFLVPQGFKNQHKLNEPSFLTDVVELIADLKNMSVNETAEILYENAKRLYDLSDTNLK